MLRFPWLLPLLLGVTLAVSCGGKSSMSQPQPSAEVIAVPLPLTLDGAIPAVPDPVEVYVTRIDGGQPKLVTETLGVPMWSWSPDEEHAALITDITDHSAKLRLISVKEGTELASADLDGYPQAAVWSPSGDWLAWKGWTEKGGTIDLIRADGSDRQEVTTTPGYGTGSSTIMGWTSGDKLLALRWEQGSDSQLLEFDPASGGERQVANIPEFVPVVTLSRDGSQAAFLNGTLGAFDCQGPPGYGLSVVDIASGSVRQVLGGVCGLETAAWSPDGRQIAYSLMTTSEDARGTYVLDLASGATRKIAGSTILFDWVEGWTADGSGVLVSRDNCPPWAFCASAAPQLFLVPVDGGSEKALVSNDQTLNATDTAQFLLSPDGSALASDQEGLQLEQLPNGPTRQAMASDSDWRFELLSWSPDGQWFSFARVHSRGYRQFEVNADGSNLKRLADLDNWNDWPAWDEGEVASPDASKAAVLGDQLKIKDVQSGEEMAVGGLRGGQAAWSPDGKTLVFATCPDNDEDPSALYLVGGDGSGLEQLTDGSARDCCPAFSPDGQTLAFVRMKDGGSEIISLSLSGLAEKSLITLDGGIPSNDWPVWSPDGSKLALNAENAGIYVVNADGSGDRQVTVAGQWFGGQYVRLRWQSNSRLYFVSMQ